MRTGVTCVCRAATYSAGSDAAEGEWEQVKARNLWERCCLLVRLDSPFITDPAPVSVSTGHFETATNPLEQIRSLQRPGVPSRLEPNVWAHLEFKNYKDKDELHCSNNAAPLTPLKSFDKTPLGCITVRSKKVVGLKQMPLEKALTCKLPSSCALRIVCCNL